MANLNVTVNPNKRYSSWFHPIWLKSGGIAYNSNTTECVEYYMATGAPFGGDYGHGWSAGNTYALNAEVEVFALGVWKNYRSLQNSNTGNTPASSPAFWEEMATSGLGADDEFWKTTPGLLRPDRGIDGTGTLQVHMYGRSAGPSGAYWDSEINGGQFAIVNTGILPAPAVRMSTSGDTCYYGYVSTASDEGGDYYEAFLYKCINGTATLIGSNTAYVTDTGNGQSGVFAYGSTIGVMRGLSTVDAAPGWPQYANPNEIVISVTDTSIPSSNNHVGVRCITGSSYPVHEWYGGEFGFLTSDQLIAGSTVTLSGLRRPGSTVTVTET